MRKLILILFLFPLFAFSQSNIVTDGGSNIVISGSNRVIITPTVYDTDVQIFFDSITLKGGKLTLNDKDRINTFVTACKTTDLWDSLIAIYPYRGDGAEAMSVNLKEPGTFDLIFINTLSSEFGYDGWVSNATSYAKTGLIPNTTLGQNSFSFGVYSGVTSPFTNRSGCYDGSRYLELIMMYSDSKAYFTNYPPIDISISYSLAKELYLMNRTSSTSFIGYINGVNKVSSSLASQSLPAIEFYISARNNNGTANNMRAGTRLHFAFLGKGLTPTQVTQLTTLVNELNSNR